MQQRKMIPHVSTKSKSPIAVSRLSKLLNNLIEYDVSGSVTISFNAYKTLAT